MSEFVTVSWDWSDEKSIQLAERRKTYLENAGYNLFRDLGGMFYGKLIYKKEDD